MKLLFYYRKGREQLVRPVLQRWYTWFQKQRVQIIVSHHRDELLCLSRSLTAIFAFGGDGTLLDTVPGAVTHSLPVVGVNVGRLGFLALFSPDNPQHAWNSLKNPKARESRLLLQLQLPNIHAHEFPVRHALNDVVFFRGASPGMLQIAVHTVDDWIGVYRGDGLILATPTGSTAYSLSCGGPVLPPGAEAFLLTPIASHNLTFRSLVLSASTQIRVQVKSRMPWQMTVDTWSKEMPAGELEIQVQVAPEKFHLVIPPDYSYFDLLRKKLMWGQDLRNQETY